MSRFELSTTEYGDVAGCDLCHCDVPTIESDHPNIIKHKGERVRLCEICYTTEIGQILAWPENHQYGPTVTLARVIAQVGNIILGKIDTL